MSRTDIPVCRPLLFSNIDRQECLSYKHIWLETLPPDSYEQVIKGIAQLINEERHKGAFALTVKATLVMGKKALSQ